MIINFELQSTVQTIQSCRLRSFEAKLLQRERMDDNGCCASECRNYMWSSYFSNCERSKAPANYREIA